MKRFFGLAVVAAFYIQNGSALRCWQCSSDVDPSCRDPFNFTSYIGGGYNSQGYQGDYDRNRQFQGDYDRSRQFQGDYDRNRQFDRDYDPRYDSRSDSRYGSAQYPRYDQNYRSGGYNRPGQQFAGRQYPQLINCDDNHANMLHKKNICYKRKQTNANGYVSVIRRCEMVELDQYAGTCYDPVQAGISVDFCEYCDYDGCNHAAGLRASKLILLVPVVVLALIQKLA